MSIRKIFSCLTVLLAAILLFPGICLSSPSDIQQLNSPQFRVSTIPGPVHKNTSDTLFEVKYVAVVLDGESGTGDFSAFRGKRIGVPVGSVIAEMVKKNIPDAELSYFDVLANLIAALDSGKIDAFAMDEPIIYMLERENSKFIHSDENLGSVDNAFIFPKSRKANPLADEIDEYIRRMKYDGTLDQIRALWFGGDEGRKVIPDYRNFPDTNGTIRIALDNETPPFSYVKGNGLAGYDVDIILRFCRERGYRPEFSEMGFSSVIPAVSSGKCDVGIGAISITPERAESVRFSESVCAVKTLLLVLKPEPKRAAPTRRPKYSSFSELDGKPIGMQPGIIEWEKWAADTLPHSQVQYYNTYPDLASALKTRKIEGFLVDSPVLALMAAEDDQLTAMSEPVGESFGYSFAFAQTEAGRKLCDEVSEYLRKIKASGELDAILSRWQGADESSKVPPDFSNLPAKNGTLTYAAEGSYPPFTYYKGTKLAGIDIDIVVRFCEVHGYGLNVQTMAFDAMIPAVNSGKVDFVGDFTPSDEHEEAVYFSEPYCEAHSVMACLKADDSPAVNAPSSPGPAGFEGYDIAYGFPKTEAGKKLCDEMSEYIRKIKASGELEALINKWTGKDEAAKVIPDYKNFPAPKGVLRMATEGEHSPMNEFAGIYIDLAVRFCEAYGYGLEITAMDSGAIIPAVASGKYDFAGAALNPTPENLALLIFSEPYYGLAGKRIGVQVGTVCAELVPERIPSAEVAYYDSLTDLLTALKAGKIDAMCCSLPAAIFAENEDQRLTRVDPPLRETYLYPIFSRTEKGRKLCDEYSEFVKGLWDDGTIDALNAKWLGKDDSKKVIEDYSHLPNTNGTVRMAVDASMMPFAYVKGSQIVGYDIDLAVMFCKAKGYSLEVENMSLTGVISSVKAGKSDFTQSMNQTPERAENTLFTSTPTMKSGNVLLVMKGQAVPLTVSADSAVKPVLPASTDGPSFWENIASSFRKTFLREDRWKLFAEGIMNTMIITVSSIFCGMLLGFIAFMFCRTGNIVANAITKFSVWLIKGTPIVVLLMILYYIVFGSVNISGIIVSIIAFTLTFGAAVYRMLTFGTGAVDNGQTEAAYALGFTDLQTFFTVILPQAALHFMPSFREEVTMLIKSTSVVGYIAVQDLTKMGDIVRSRTYEAFFPLIAVAVIYFVLAGALNVIVTAIELRITPSRRKPDDILRGIDRE